MNKPIEKKHQEDELGQLLGSLHGLASDQVFHHLSLTMHAVDLSFSQITALFRLLHHGPQNITALARGVHLSHAAASRLVDKLVREGLVFRSQDPDNRRQKLIRLSPKGGGYLAGLQEITAQVYTELFSDVPARLRQDLRSLIKETKPYLSAEAGAAAGESSQAPF